MPYLTLEEFRSRTTMPTAFVDELEAMAPGWIATQLGDVSADIDSRLRKRYAAPFLAPIPLTVLRWLTRIVTRECFLKRGVDPDDRQFEEYVNAANKADDEIKEAAEAEKGLFDLPLRADTTATGISKGGPYAYSEQSPYVGGDVQVDIARNEDRNRRGTDG